MLAALVTAAGAGSGGGLDVGWLIQQGGAFLGLVILGYVAWRESNRADIERAARNELADQFMEKVIPALVESTRVQREFIELARKETRARDR